LTEEEDKANNSIRISTFLGPRRESNKKMLPERCSLVSPNHEAKQDNLVKSSGGVCKEKRDTTKLCSQP